MKGIFQLLKSYLVNLAYKRLRVREGDRGQGDKRSVAGWREGEPGVRRGWG